MTDSTSTATPVSRTATSAPTGSGWVNGSTRSATPTGKARWTRAEPHACKRWPVGYGTATPPADRSMRRERAFDGADPVGSQSPTPAPEFSLIHC